MLTIYEKLIHSIRINYYCPRSFVGCSSTGGKYENSGNTAYLDGEGKKRGLFGGRKRKQSAPLQNPNINIRVDPRLARSLTYSRVRTDGPFIAMTFDDGPHPVHTPSITGHSQKKEHKSYLFCCGDKCSTVSPVN